MICFDDKTTHLESWPHDWFTSIREFHESWNAKLGQAIVPGRYLAIAECLYPTRCQISFKTHNPSFAIISYSFES